MQHNTMRHKFSLRTFKGEPTRHFLVDEAPIDASALTLTVSPSHHIFIVDASGSMSADMEEMKSTIEKLFTLEEYHGADSRFTLISYASEGDLVVHFSRVKVSELSRSGSEELVALRALETRGATCISQALKRAVELIQADELTCISLHSDGYANDSDPNEERALLKSIVQRLQESELMVFVNTFAYRSSADYTLLSYIASALSGRCLQASALSEMYEALKGSTDALLAPSVPTYTSSGEGCDYQVFVSAEMGRVNGSSGDLKVRGITDGRGHRLYRYHEVDAETFESASVPECGVGEHSVQPLAAYAHSQLMAGQLNTAKYGLVSMRASQLLSTHAKALTVPQLASLSEELKRVAFSGLNSSEPRAEAYGLPSAEASVLSVLRALAARAQVQVDLNALTDGYKSASVRRVEGSRDEDGALTPPWVDTRPAGDPSRARVLKLEINRNDAEIDLLVAQEVELFNRETGERIDEVEGIELRGKLRSFNSYKIVTGGALSVPSLTVKLESKQVHRRLVELGALEGEFEPTSLYTISLEGRPLVDYELEVGSLSGCFKQLCLAKAIESTLSALISGGSVDYTDAQLKALERHHITPALQLSLPTTTPYTDLQQAIAEGSVDTRVNYKIDLGDEQLLNIGKLRSANAQLARRFELSVNGVVIEKPKLLDWWRGGAQASARPLGPRQSVDAVDALMNPLLEDLLDLGAEGSLSDGLRSLGVAEELVEQVSALKRRLLSDEEAELSLLKLRAAVRARSRSIYEDEVSPLVFYIGATGLLPDGLPATLLSAEELQAQAPNLKLSKADHEKQYFSVEGAIISVYAAREYYSVSEG